MKPTKLSRLPRQCFYNDCQSRFEENKVATQSPLFSLLIRKGFFHRSSDSRRIARFQCRRCRRTFSQASYSECFGQKRRTLNEPMRKLFVSGMTQRGAAWILGTTRKTVVRKFLFLGSRAERSNQKFLSELVLKKPFTHLQFDEMESFERSKCLPVSIPLLVCSKSRKILGFRVCSMSAKRSLS
jgi:transposase-like protein